MVLLMCSCSAAKSYVSYTVYPLGYLLNRIAPERFEFVSLQNDNLVQGAQVVEDYETIINDSIYLFHIGELEPYLEVHERLIEESNVQTVDLSILNAIYDFKRYILVYANGEDAYVGSSYYIGHGGFGNIDKYDLDLCIWVDPVGMLSMAQDITELLSTDYAEFADEFQANYEKLKDELIALDVEYQNVANQLKNNSTTLKFVTMSPSFGNWQKTYGFQVYPIVLSRYGVLPNEIQLETIKQRIISDEVKYIVHEPNMTAEMEALFSQLETELGLTRVEMSNISSLTADQRAVGEDYLSLMRKNLSVLQEMAALVLQGN